jgi:hypothetical protein
MVALAAGYHPVRIEYFQAGGGKALELRMRQDGGLEWGYVVGKIFVEGGRAVRR